MDTVVPRIQPATIITNNQKKQKKEEQPKVNTRHDKVHPREGRNERKKEPKEEMPC